MTVAVSEARIVIQLLSSVFVGIANRPATKLVEVVLLVWKISQKY